MSSEEGVSRVVGKSVQGCTEQLVSRRLQFSRPAKEPRRRRYAHEAGIVSWLSGAQVCEQRIHVVKRLCFVRGVLSLGFAYLTQEELPPGGP